jgi:hypothetical protein
MGRSISWDAAGQGEGHAKQKAKNIFEYKEKE